MNLQTVRNYDLEAAFHEAEQNFTEANPKSHANYEKACQSLPGGNTRTVLYYAPFPLTIAKGDGCYVWDLDGHRYADFVGEYSAGLYGHSNPVITQAVKDALDRGIVFGGQNEAEPKLAAAIVERWPSVERVRFTNSGTEGNLMAISAARAATGRSKILVFEGAYHGAVFGYANPESPINAPFPTVVAQFNDTEGTVKLIEEHADDLALVVLEPMQVGAGCIPAKKEFLEAIRAATEKHGVVLIFDEVMTSRLTPGGAQEFYGVMPDLTAFGKYLGGGLTFGAFGGRADIMDRFDPRRKDALPHAGTFNQNILTMTAGYTGLSKIFTPEKSIEINARGDKLRERLNGLFDKHGIAGQVTGLGSINAVHFNPGTIESKRDADNDNVQARELLHFDMLGRAQYMARRGMIVLSLPITDTEIEGYVTAFDDFLTERAPLLA